MCTISKNMSEELKKNLNKKSNRNWVRAALSLRYFKQGFETFVNNEVMGHHADILKRLQEEEGVLSLHCGECTSENLLPQHSVQKKCIQKNRRHCFCNEQFSRRRCPTKVCSLLYDYIVKAHSTNDPLWANTDPSKWLTDYWELGKCFLSTFGYADKSSAAETDAIGLLSIAINDTYIQERMETDIESLTKVKDTRNIILHSASLSLEDDVVIKYIDEMIQVLQDRKAFASDATAKDAILHLNELKNVQCHISFEDELEVREETLKAIKEMANDAVCMIRSTEANVKDGLRDYTKELRNQVKESTSEEVDRTISCSVTFHRESAHKETQTAPPCHTIINNSVPVMEIYTRCQHSAGIEREAELQTNTKGSEKQIKQPGNGANADLKSSDRRMSSYSNDKQQMQAALIELYQQFFIKTDLSPLLPEVQIDIDRVYVPPQLYKTDRIDGYKDPKHEYYNIYGDVKKYRLKASEFLTKIVKKNILITADAGMGKTALCRQMVSAWCAAHEKSFASPDPTPPPSISDESDENSWFKYFRDIDFLFFISLKYCNQELTIEEMILKQLINDRYHDSFYKLLQYEEEKCLVILDDLNEWIPPGGALESPTISQGLPLRQIKSTYTTMYTARPWKLATIRPKSGEFDMIIELEGIDTGYTDKHITLVSHYLNKRTCRQRNSEHFLASLTDKNLNHLTMYPLLSKLLLCLWHDKTNLDTSLAGIYSAVVDRLICQAYRRGALSHLDKSDGATEHLCMMTMYSGKEYLKRYFDSVVLPLTEFSFCLFKCKRRFCYIFESTNLHSFGLSEDKLNLFLNIGILSERICYGRSVSERCKTISFVYETFQDFFAAVYFSICPNEISDCCRTTENILRMSLVFRILSGLNFSALKIISDRTLNIIDNDKNGQDYRRGSSSYKGSVIEIQRMWTRCIKEARRCRIRIEPLAIRDIYLGYGTSEYMLSVCDIDFGELRSLYCDIEIPLYTQEHIAQASQLDMLVCNNAEYMDNNIMGDILRKNQSSLKCLELSGEYLAVIDITANMFLNLRKLMMSETVLKGEQFAKLVTNSCSLEKVQLCNLYIFGSEDVGNEANSSNIQPFVSSIQHLKMSHCDNVFKFVSSLPSLKSLHFENSSSHYLYEILHKSTNLTKLTIDQVHVGSDRNLADWISKQQHLRFLCLQNLEVNQCQLFELLDVVGYLPVIVRVKLNNVEHEEGTRAKNVLQHLETTKLFSYSKMAFEAAGNFLENADMLSFGKKVSEENR